jgi:hypothetical protein
MELIMGFKKEVREFIQDVREFMKAQIVGKQVYLDTIEQLRQQNDDLHRKLLARNLPELQTYSFNENTIQVEDDYDPSGDIENAGLIADFGNE